MKIVYNACYGGFSLSLAGEKLYLEKLGQKPIYHKDEKYRFERYYSEEQPDFYCREIERDDPALVAVVEELGQAASGDCANLCVRDIPAGTLYRIDEYDGLESVVTQDEYDWKVAK